MQPEARIKSAHGRIESPVCLIYMLDQQLRSVGTV